MFTAGPVSVGRIEAHTFTETSQQANERRCRALCISATDCVGVQIVSILPFVCNTLHDAGGIPVTDILVRTTNIIVAVTFICPPTINFQLDPLLPVAGATVLNYSTPASGASTCAATLPVTAFVLVSAVVPMHGPLYQTPYMLDVGYSPSSRVQLVETIVASACFFASMLICHLLPRRRLVPAHQCRCSPSTQCFCIPHSNQSS
jgi:hypothetical protein